MTSGVGFGVFSTDGGPPRVGFRVGQGVLDLPAAGLGSVFAAPSLNPFLALGRTAWEDTLGRIRDLVSNGSDLVPLERARIHLPFTVADYVDFYSSLEHATNLGRLFRPDAEPLLPNWRHLPVGYHGRSGTVIVSGTPVLRPSGQVKAPGDAAPRFGPSRRACSGLPGRDAGGRPGRRGAVRFGRPGGAGPRGLRPRRGRGRPGPGRPRDSRGGRAAGAKSTWASGW